VVYRLSDSSSWRIRLRRLVRFSRQAR
jgi:hypothetical protein